MSEALRKEVPLGLAAFVIAFLFLDYYIANPYTKWYAGLLSDWAIIIAALAAGVGILNLSIRTIRDIIRRRPYWYLDVWTIFLMIAMAAVGVIGVYGSHPAFKWMFEFMYLPVDASMYGMVMFDIAYAFYLCFRMRSKESVVLFLTGIIVLVANAPMFGSVWLQGVTLGEWVSNIPSGAGSRAFTIVAAIGVIGFAVRMMFLKERPTLGVVD